MLPSVNAQPLAAARRLCSGSVAPAVTLPACVGRANRLPPRE